MSEPPSPKTVPIKAVASASEYSVVFLQGMLDRMAVSEHKYGLVSDAYPHKFSALDSLNQRLDRYIETGNTEFLIDAANFAMIEFMLPSAKGAHFEPTDSDGSPGRTTNTGMVLKRTRNDGLGANGGNR